MRIDDGGSVSRGRPPHNQILNRDIGKINAKINGVFSKSNESVFALKVT